MTARISMPLVKPAKSPEHEKWLSTGATGVEMTQIRSCPCLLTTADDDNVLAVKLHDKLRQGLVKMEQS